MRLFPAGLLLLFVGIVDGKYWKPSSWNWTPQSWHSRLKIHHGIVSAQSESESSEGDFPSVFKNSEVAFKEALTESGAEQLHNYESQADPDSVPDDSEFRDVVWKDFPKCPIRNFNLYLFVSCYMEYFGLKHYETFNKGRRALYSKKFKAIKLGAISALIEHYTGCDLDLTNYDDLEERERYKRMGRTISPQGSWIEECQSVYHRHTIELDIDQDSTNQHLKIKFSDNRGNKIHVERRDANSWRLAIGVAHKGIMVASRIDKHTLQFGLKCSLCGDSIEIIENCEQRRVLYSTGVTFHVPFVLVDSCVDEVESSASGDSKDVTQESISIEETVEEEPRPIRKSKLNSKIKSKRKQLRESTTKLRIKPKKRAKHKPMHDAVLKLKLTTKRQRKPKPKHDLNQESEPSTDAELELETESESEIKHRAETESEVEHEPEIEPEQEADPGQEAQAEPESEDEFETESIQEPEPNSEQESEPSTDTELEDVSESESEPKSEIKHGAESESEAEHEPELEPEQEADPGQEAEAEPESEDELETESIQEPEPSSKPEKLIDMPTTLEKKGHVINFGEQLFQRGPHG
ncbi:proteoglycan 4 [Ditylenchus destructor]|uniref:Proteoglycan 4 n=1 Tax=Ditylenchus destructor TaxID=166010 RepID=A0AAD4ND62_9BILA|nr:proteoglycan 4 [Ditylenchus destructor]